MITKSISEGFRFAFSVKRVIPYIILDLIIFYLLFIFFRSFIDMIRSENFNLVGIFTSLGLMVPAFIIISLVQLWISGAIIDQARYFPKEKPLTKSFGYSTSRYLPMFCALIIYSIIAFIISMPKYIGSILAFVLSLILYYLYPSIIVGRKRCIDAFKDSYRTFIRYPLETFVTWILQMIITLIIIGLFSLPLIFLFLGQVIDVFVKATINPTNISGPEPFVNSLVPSMISAIRSPYFIPYLFILVVALSFTNVFNLGVQTRLYLNARKIEL